MFFISLSVFLFLFSFQTAQSNFYSRQLFEDSPSSSLLRSTYSQRQEQRYLLQAQLEQELLQNQIHQRYLEQQQRLFHQHQQQKSAYAKLPPLAQNKLPHQKYPQHSNRQSNFMSDGRSIPVQDIQSQSQSQSNPQSQSHSQSQSHFNNTGDSPRLPKQIHFNLNNVNQYYHSNRPTDELLSLASLRKSIGYNTCNNNNNTQTKPYRNNFSCSNKNDNNNDTYIEYLQKPIKMQREEIIIEHSQLVLNGNGNNGNETPNATNTAHRSNRYTQVSVFCLYIL